MFQSESSSFGTKDWYTADFMPDRPPGHQHFCRNCAKVCSTDECHHYKRTFKIKRRVNRLCLGNIMGQPPTCRIPPESRVGETFNNGDFSEIGFSSQMPEISSINSNFRTTFRTNLKQESPFWPEPFACGRTLQFPHDDWCICGKLDEST